jgi:hypothetical protein
MFSLGRTPLTAEQGAECAHQITREYIMRDRKHFPEVEKRERAVKYFNGGTLILQ